VPAAGVFALDLDGTLLASDGTLSAATRAAVADAVDAGWHVVLATARWHQLAARTASELGVSDPVIASSGAHVRRHDGVDLVDLRLPARFTDALYDYCDDVPGAVFAVQRDEVQFRRPGTAAAPPHPELTIVESWRRDGGRDPRCVLVHGEELCARVRAELAPSWAASVRFLTSISSRGTEVLTVTAAGGVKGLALAVVAAHLGVPRERVVAMGDSETDVEMFRVAGRSVAMGQAPIEVRDAASWVTDTNDADGVAQAIRRVLTQD
jgi:Cof subfamily protein (haloacid dehalogenase superfamily)